MPAVVKSPQARRDVAEIAARIAADKLAASDRWIAQIDERLQALAEWPGMGQARGRLGHSLRSYPFGKYLIFFRPIQDGIEIVRVLHGARALHRHYFNE